MLCFLILAWVAQSIAEAHPNLIMLVIDDVGWADVSFHGGNFSTTNIDYLATKEGVRLESFYVQPVCSPTRSALMTGRYPFKTGLQHFSTIFPGSKAAIPKDVPTIAEVLKQAGYSTHAIGKWHLGSASWDNTPTGRGFDSHAGYFQAHGDYYKHTLANGYDFWRNQTPAWDSAGDYSMDLYMSEALRILETHDPKKPFFLYFAHQLIHEKLQLPPKLTGACDAITADLPYGADRNALCSMMVELDTQIGVFVSWLKEKRLWNNTVVWVTSDNGGMTTGEKDSKLAKGEYSVSSNFPLRAGKTSLFEGGVRAVNFVTGGLIPRHQFGTVRSGLLQHVDIPVTLAALAGVKIESSDGLDIWNYIISGGESPRTEVPINIDTCVGFAGGGPPCQRTLTLRKKQINALIQGKWKLISGFAPGTCDGSVYYDGWWSNDPYTRRMPNATQGPVEMDGENVFLFDLSVDECENNNLALAHPEIVKKMQARIDELADPKNGYVDAQYNLPAFRSLPRFHNGTWEPWLQHNPADIEDEDAEVLV